MPTSPFTPAEQAHIRAIAGVGRRSVKDTLVLAEHLTALNETRSLTVLESVTVEHGLTDVRRTRIGVLIRAYQAAPSGVTAADFVNVYVKAETDRNRDAGKAKAAATKAKQESAKADGPQGNADAVRPVTVKDAVRILWDLVAEFGEDAAFITAIKDAENYVQAGIVVAA